MSRYLIRRTNTNGDILDTLPTVVNLKLAVVLGDVSVLTLTLAQEVDLAADQRLIVTRCTDDGATDRLCIAFVRAFGPSHTNDGTFSYRVYAEGLNNLLARRIVGFAAGSAQAEKTDSVDDMMVSVVDENLVSPSDADRDVTNLTTATSPNDGPSITKAFAWRNVLTVLQDLQAISKTEGTEVFFGIEDLTLTSWEFRTATGQWGADRTTNEPIQFSLQWGNLSDPQLDYDYINEASYIYAGGQGQGSDRNVQEVSDTTRINETPYGRIEAFTSAAQADTDAAVQAAGNDTLGRRRPKTRFSGKIHATPATPYGGTNGWKLGDKVPIYYQGITFDAIVRGVLFEVDNNGAENISARVESV